MEFSFGVLLFYLLLLSGDISLNPGPVRYPCAVCHLSVRSNQRALLCDECGLWCHCKCCGVSKGQYQSYQSLSCFTWLCQSCLSRNLPFYNCSFLCSPGVKHSSCSPFRELSFTDDIQQNPFPSPPSTTHSFLTFAHLNCHCLLAYLDDVLLFIQNHSIDVMTLSETWLDDTVSDLEVCPPHYDLNIVRRDRNRRGGSVAILFSSHVQFRSCFDLSDGNVESLWVELFPNSKHAVLLCCIYRSPSDCHLYR